MQQITTKVIPATNFRGTRIRAKSTNGATVYVSYHEADNAILHCSDIDRHTYACETLLRKLEWYATGLRMVVLNSTDQNGYTFAFLDDLREVAFVRNEDSNPKKDYTITRPLS